MKFIAVIVENILQPLATNREHNIAQKHLIFPFRQQGRYLLLVVSIMRLFTITKQVLIMGLLQLTWNSALHFQVSHFRVWTQTFIQVSNLSSAAKPGFRTFPSVYYCPLAQQSSIRVFNSQYLTQTDNSFSRFPSFKPEKSIFWFTLIDPLIRAMTHTPLANGKK